MARFFLASKDPRTLARNIPGLFDVLFPQLVPGMVAFLNRRSVEVEDVTSVSQSMVDQSGLQHAMLFELAVAAAEHSLDGKTLDWDLVLSLAVARQQRFFDAEIPLGVSEVDKAVAGRVAENLCKMLAAVRVAVNGDLLRSPQIPGYEWISTGVGDFAVGKAIIEVKCTNKHFSASDFRQVLIYWLLSYLAAIEQKGVEWEQVVLLNPRLNRCLTISFDELIRRSAVERSKVDLAELFSTLISSYSEQ